MVVIGTRSSFERDFPLQPFFSGHHGSSVDRYGVADTILVDFCIPGSDTEYHVRGCTVAQEL